MPDDGRLGRVKRAIRVQKWLKWRCSPSRFGWFWRLASLLDGYLDVTDGYLDVPDGYDVRFAEDLQPVWA